MKKHDPLKFFSLGTKPRVQAFPFQFLQGVGGAWREGKVGVCIDPMPARRVYMK